MFYFYWNVLCENGSQKKKSKNARTDLVGAKA